MPEQTNSDNTEQKKNQPDTEKDDAAKETKLEPVDPVKRRRNILIGVVVVVIILVAGMAWWLHSRTYETTDDAQVDGHLNLISARVAGTIKGVYVEDNQRVQAGQPIVDLDTRDAEVNLAQADYDQALAQLNAESPNAPIQQSSNKSDMATLEVVNADAAVQGAEHD